jgi:hypothetical protein
MPVGFRHDARFFSRPKQPRIAPLTALRLSFKPPHTPRALPAAVGPQRCNHADGAEEESQHHARPERISLEGSATSGNAARNPEKNSSSPISMTRPLFSRERIRTAVHSTPRQAVAAIVPRPFSATYF